MLLSSRYRYLGSIFIGGFILWEMLITGQSGAVILRTCNEMCVKILDVWALCLP